MVSTMTGAEGFTSSLHQGKFGFIPRSVRREGFEPPRTEVVWFTAR